MPKNLVGKSSEERSSPSEWARKDLLGLQELSVTEIETILRETEIAKKDFLAGTARRNLQGQMAALVFSEPSTRTRTSFEVALRKLGAEVLGFSSEGSSALKGESFEDTLLNLQAMQVGFFVVRHSTSGIVETVARKIRSHVINAGDGSHEHPTQALLDIFTLKEKKGRVAGLKIVIVGDITHSRVARSNIWGLTKLKAKVTVCGPATLIPSGIESLGATVSHDLTQALQGADAVNVLRLQSERQKENLLPSLVEYHRLYGLTAAKLAHAKEDCLVLHPGPMNRGVEIDSDVADGPQSIILEQVTNGVAVRMAILSLLSRS